MNWLILLILFVFSILFYILDLFTALRVAVKYPTQFKQSETNLALCWVFEAPTKEEYDKRYAKFTNSNIGNFAMLIIICFLAGSILGIGNLNSLALPIIVQLIVSIVGIGTNLYATWKLGRVNNQTIIREVEDKI